ncbi:MAG TPA: MltA domain-containing protein [Burkholderiales bacterium]|nr:MltA domain-containing protein [Burkholderiales bacterium]
MSRLLSVVAILLIAACQQLPEKPAPPKPPGPERAQYIQASFSVLPGWSTTRLEPSLRAYLAGCARAPAVLLGPCGTATTIAVGDEEGARRFFETYFTPYAIVSSETGDTGTITGYYEPVLRGSRTRDNVNRFPIFGVPDDLIVVDLGNVAPETRNLRLRGRLDGRRLVPYYTRAEIDARGETFKAPIIGWTADPVELFFLQIQGSGQLELENGDRVRLAYADQNGHPYRSMGRYLIDHGEMTLDQASMQGIKSWAAANPGKLQDALNVNASYVFFRESTDPRGVVGALGVPLVPQYRLAVDRRFIPLGAPVFLSTTFPLSDQPLARLAAAHDTGGAIRGAVRADFFWGTGPDAGVSAGRMRQPGKMWLLWPRGEALPRGE